MTCSPTTENRLFPRIPKYRLPPSANLTKNRKCTDASPGQTPLPAPHPRGCHDHALPGARLCHGLAGCHTGCHWLCQCLAATRRPDPLWVPRAHHQPPGDQPGPRPAALADPHGRRAGLRTGALPRGGLDSAAGGAKSATLLPTEVVEVLGRAPLAGRQQMHLLRCGNKLLLVSVTPTGAETLTEVTDPVEVDRLSGLCRQAASAECHGHLSPCIPKTGDWSGGPPCLSMFLPP